MNLDYSKLISMPLEQVYAEGQDLDEPTPIHDELTRDRRSVELQFGDGRAVYAAQQLEQALAEPVIDDELEQPADVVVEQWAWWKKWALILAVGGVLAIIGYGWLVQA
ncbi:hypothetical protein AXA44_02790 [Rhodococcus sp. SC4]|nr:hypothetical protein AXA44_02790 [Rhodococcus sp. SC4]